MIKIHQIIVKNVKNGNTTILSNQQLFPKYKITIFIFKCNALNFIYCVKVGSCVWQELVAIILAIILSTRIRGQWSFIGLFIGQIWPKTSFVAGDYYRSECRSFANILPLICTVFGVEIFSWSGRLWERCLSLSFSTWNGTYI